MDYLGVAIVLNFILNIVDTVFDKNLISCQYFGQIQIYL
jgi:hypothetical protein